ncbi:hypothetical protein L596_020456 [Steinernema carpocapsae]|uniref:Alpha-mannosidase n=1 Tax=Steinernema carpocapsae TaxID=34508 RepID=A0A4V6A0W9_STECR|nr:hypothetical protein L596_020456 [Steinernema carpocapsae]
MRSLALVLLLQALLVGADRCSWNKCPNFNQDKDVLNVHLICHTHDDLGWIKTVDQYYYGSKPELVPVGVQYIFNTVIDELEKDPSRRFSFAETGFLWRWWITHDEPERARLKKLIQNGQIELISGGWVQNDEAASHYIEIIDQMSFGLRELNRTFGECGRPKVAWQIDPFGHSKEFANLASKFGFSALFFARMHYLEKESRISDKSLEFVWDTSEELKTAILTGAFFQDNYGPPPGFCFDTLCGDDPIMDNPMLEDFNVDRKVKLFVDHIKKQANTQRHNHIMLLMGSDFQYTNANTWYTNLDKLIKHVMERANKTVNVFYSTPACYVNAVTKSGVHLNQKKDDFFPYASSNHSYWTGYFTSRPTFKRYIREANGYLQLLKKMDTFAFANGGGSKWFDKLDRATALTQHHDAITGTAKQAVTDDYMKRISIAWDQGTESLYDMVDKITQKSENGTKLPKQQFCRLNETNCDISKKNPNFTVTVFNSYTQPVTRVVRVPIYQQKAQVYDKDGQRILGEVVKSFLTSQLPADGRTPFELHFTATIPPLGFTTFFVISGAKHSKNSRKSEHLKKLKNTTTRWRRDQNNETSVNNGIVELTFDADGFLKSFKDIKSGVSKPLRQEFFFYKGMDNTTDQPTGAYIFRPNGSEPLAVTKNVTLKVVKTNQSIEVRQIFNEWVSQVIRLDGNCSVVFFQWTVGPIPKEAKNPIAKEVISRFTSDLVSNGYFYTDSNGRQMMERKRDTAVTYKYENTEPVAANYYPVTSTIYIQDSKNQLTVCTDRAQGGSSLKDGQIELMVHRRAFHDDHWGVDEPLDEPGRTGKGLVATGTHYLMLGSGDSSKLNQRVLAQQIFHEPLNTFGEFNGSIEEYIKERKTEFTGLLTPLPPHVNVLTLELVKQGVVILRLEHILQNLEDKIRSQPSTVDLKGMFSGFEIVKIDELTLGANEYISSQGPIRVRRRLLEGNTNIEIGPMDIKTFRLEVKPSADY